jgi:hypothetical protein
MGSNYGYGLPFPLPRPAREIRVALRNSLAMVEIDKAPLALQEDHCRVSTEDRGLIFRLAATDDFFEADHASDWVFCVPVVDLFLQLCSSGALRCWHFCVLHLISDAASSKRHQ